MAPPSPQTPQRPPNRIRAAATCLLLFLLCAFGTIVPKNHGFSWRSTAREQPVSGERLKEDKAGKGLTHRTPHGPPGKGKVSDEAKTKHKRADVKHHRDSRDRIGGSPGGIAPDTGGASPAGGFAGSGGGPGAASWNVGDPGLHNIFRLPHGDGPGGTGMGNGGSGQPGPGMNPSLPDQLGDDDPPGGGNPPQDDNPLLPPQGPATGENPPQDNDPFPPTQTPATMVPEPSTILLLAPGLAIFARKRRRLKAGG